MNTLKRRKTTYRNEALNKLSKINYISLPATMEAETEGFKLDPSVLLPIESQVEDIQQTINALSWEMIIAAILKIMAWDPEHKDIPYYRQLITAVRPDIIEELTRAAFAKSNSHDYELAEEILTALSILAPENTACMLNLALLQDDRSAIYRQNGNEELQNKYEISTKACYDKLINSNQEPPLLALYYAALFYARIEDYTSAKTLLSKFIDQTDDKKKKTIAEKVLNTITTEMELSTHFNKSMQLISGKKEEEGIELIQKVLKQHPDIWNGWFLLGWGYRRIANFKKAKNAFEKALALKEDQADIYNELSICNMELNKLSESRNNLETAIKLEPFNIKILSNMAILELKENNSGEAVKYFKQVLEIDKEDPIALSWLESIKKENENSNIQT